MRHRRRTRGKKTTAENVEAGIPDHTVNKLDSVVLSDRARPGNKKRLMFITGAILIVLAAGATYWYMIRSRSDEPKPTIDQSDADAAITLRKNLINSKDYETTHTDYLILGNAYLEKNDYEAAESAFKEAESLNGTDLDVKYALATVYRLQERRAESLEYYDEVIALASKEESAYYGNLATYKAERDAVADDDFDLKNVEQPSDLPL